MTAQLEDGTYDALVVDAAEQPDGSARLELTIVSGAHKGQVVSLRAAGMADRAFGLLGIPATLTVAGGEPTVALEP